MTIDDLNEKNDGGAGLSRRQVWYLLLPQGLVAAILDGLVSFGLASLMYRTTSKEIRLWGINKNTIAGDIGLTIIIQSILTTIIIGILVREDIRQKRITPFPFSWPDVDVSKNGSKIGRLWGKALLLLSPKETFSLEHGYQVFVQALFANLLRGFLISIPYFLVLWPLSLAILVPFYGKASLNGTWTPEIIKAIFGAVLGLAQTPVIASLVLGAHPPSALLPPPATMNIPSIVKKPQITSVRNSLRSSPTMIRTSPTPSTASPPHPKIMTTTPLAKDLTTPSSTRISTISPVLTQDIIHVHNS